MSSDRYNGGFGSIPHLKGSKKTTDKDISVDDNYHRLACDAQAPNPKKNIYNWHLQEKLDGCCVGVIRKGEKLTFVSRNGYRCEGSDYPHLQLFHHWAQEHKKRFLNILQDGEEAWGEWILVAHTTQYTLNQEPYVLFEIRKKKYGKKGGYFDSMPFDKVRLKGSDELEVADNKTFGQRTLVDTAKLGGFNLPHTKLRRKAPSISEALKVFPAQGYHGAHGPIEGFVWMVEEIKWADHKLLCIPRMRAKFVKPEKEDGVLLPERQSPWSAYIINQIKHQPTLDWINSLPPNILSRLNIPS